MQGTVFTLARLKIVPTIKNLICRCLTFDCEMSVENYMFLVRFFFVNFSATTKLIVLSEIFIKVLSNHIFLESHIVT